jgi:hypothetical protein
MHEGGDPLVGRVSTLLKKQPQIHDLEPKMAVSW